MKGRVLVVDNDPEMLALLRQHLESDGRLVTTASGGGEAVAALEGEEFDVVLTDLVMDRVDGWTVLRETQRLQPGARVVLMTAFASLETAIDAMRQGAYDYLTKPFKLAEVTLALDRAVDDRRLREENRRLRVQVEQRFGFDNLIGRAKAMQEVFDKIRAVAGTDATILLLGESGTGKELVARAIHHNSARHDRPFVPVNCAAIPHELLESELFGHEKGAFTGAIRKRRGLFAEAEGGTLFLDEVGDIPPALQGKILRALQDRTVRPVGGSEEIRLDVRVVSATHRDLVTLVGEGRFREDLYYRLAVIPIRLPSLRERPEDILLLAEHFLRRSATAGGKSLEGFDEAATAWLLQHRWPGNVRELENVVERATTLARGPQITRTDLGIEFALEASGVGLRPTLVELEERYIRRVLEETKGDKVAAARILDISVRTLQRRFHAEPDPPSTPSAP
jgi:DNA-binding NtrC family response regulator